MAALFVFAAPAAPWAMRQRKYVKDVKVHFQKTPDSLKMQQLEAKLSNEDIHMFGHFLRLYSQKRASVPEATTLEMLRERLFLNHLDAKIANTIDPDHGEGTHTPTGGGVDISARKAEYVAKVRLLFERVYGLLGTTSTEAIDTYIRLLERSNLFTYALLTEYLPGKKGMGKSLHEAPPDPSPPRAHGKVLVGKDFSLRNIEGVANRVGLYFGQTQLGTLDMVDRQILSTKHGTPFSGLKVIHSSPAGLLLAMEDSEHRPFVLRLTTGKKYGAHEILTVSRRSDGKSVLYVSGVPRALFETQDKAEAAIQELVFDEANNGDDPLRPLPGGRIYWRTDKPKDSHLKSGVEFPDSRHGKGNTTSISHHLDPDDGVIGVHRAGKEPVFMTLSKKVGPHLLLLVSSDGISRPTNDILKLSHSYDKWELDSVVLQLKMLNTSTSIGRAETNQT